MVTCRTAPHPVKKKKKLETPHEQPKLKAKTPSPITEKKMGFLLFFIHISTFQFLEKPWSQVGVVPFPPPVLAFIFYRAYGSAVLLLVDFSSNGAINNSRSRVFRKSICAQEKSPPIYTSMHSGGFKLTKLAYTRLEDNLIRHQGDRQTIEAGAAMT